MTIFRTHHDKNFTTINNYICRDNRLSWKAKGIWLYAFSNRDSWTFYLSDLINQSTDGKDSVNAGLKELEKYGYLIRYQEKDEKGRFEKVEWDFYELPQDFKKTLPETDFPIADNLAPGRPPLTNTNITNTVAVVAEPPALSFSDCKKLSKDDVYSRSINTKKDWSAAEIEVAYQKYLKYSYDITDHMALIDGIIKKLRTNNQINEEKKCKTTKKSQVKTALSRKNSNDTLEKQKSKNENSLTTALKVSNQEFSEQDTSETPLAKFARLNPFNPK